MQVVLDTVILVKAFVDGTINCSKIVLMAGDWGHKIALDHDNFIVEEYRKNLGGNRHFEIWYSEQFRHCTFNYSCSKLTEKHHTELVARKFHEPSDLIFLGVALNTDRIIVTEDSDYGKSIGAIKRNNSEALRYIEDKMNVTVMNYDDAVINLSQNK